MPFNLLQADPHLLHLPDSFCKHAKYDDDQEEEIEIVKYNHTLLRIVQEGALNIFAIMKSKIM